MQHAQADEVVDGRLGGLRFPPLLTHHLRLFAASVLAIFYLSRLFVLALLVYREHVAPNAWQGVLMAAADWRKEAFGRQTVIVGCKWGTVAPWLIISFIMSFHLLEILGIRANETWYDPFCFHFFRLLRQ
jgi:hypothetical protein